MSFVVELSPTAEADLERLFDFLLDRAETSEDLDHAQAAIDAIKAAAQHRLAVTPFSFRKASRNPAQRELIIPFAGTGYIAPYESGLVQARPAPARPCGPDRRDAAW